MPDMKIEQALNEKDYREAYTIFYSTYNTWMKVRTRVGPLLMVLGIVLYWSHLYQPAVNLALTLFFIFYGVFMLVSKYIYVSRALRASKTSKSFGKPMRIELTSDGKLKRVTGNEGSVMEIKNLYGYRSASEGVLLYLQTNLFVFLKRAAVEQAGGEDLLQRMLDIHGVRKLT